LFVQAVDAVIGAVRAVVLHVDDQCVALETAPLQGLENLTDPLVGALENREVILPRRGVVLVRLDEAAVVGGH
jgi:hypothetical protein